MATDDNEWRVVRLTRALEDLDSRSSGQVKKILAQLVKNIMKEPENETFRVLSETNPAVRKMILNVEGGKRCLVATGFKYSGTRKAFVCRSPKEELISIQDALFASLNGLPNTSKNKSQERKATKSKEKNKFVEREGPTTKDFKRFPDGVIGLKRRWAEVSFTLRGADNLISGNDGALQDCIKNVQMASEGLHSLEALCKKHDLLQGPVFLILVSRGGGTPASTIVKELRKKIEAILGLDENLAIKLAQQAVGLQQLVRLKIADDADLDTARRAILDISKFFELLSEHATKEGTTAKEVLRIL